MSSMFIRDWFSPYLLNPQPLPPKHWFYTHGF
jgi:hypothetical protein